MIDSRAYSEEKINAPMPLPYVSRRALKRCRDALPPIKECNLCGGDVEIVGHAEIYNGAEYGCWPYVYKCEDCDAYVGIHRDTDLPLGTLADKKIREARKDCKHYFMELMRWKDWDMNTGYDWLYKEMDMPRAECHFGMFDVKRCKQAAVCCIKELGWTELLPKFY